MSAFAGYLEASLRDVEQTLDRLLPAAGSPPGKLHEAMRYSVLGAGKRLRPTLVRLAGETWGAPLDALLAGGAAIEMIHGYSLIHAALPALDDDDLRRGRATLHREYDEATAILAGDALLTLGLTVLAREPSGLAPEVRARAVSRVGEAIGTAGMIGGQVEDLEAEARWPEAPAAALDRIHRRKTGALIGACLELGGLYARVPSPQELILKELGERIGLIFQIRDDILDVEGTAGSLGKTPGKDAVARKLTFPGLHGLEASRARIVQLSAEAMELVAEFPSGRELWASLVDYVGQRAH